MKPWLPVWSLVLLWSLELGAWSFARRLIESTSPVINPRDRLSRFIHSFPRKIQRRPIMHPHQRIPHLASAVSLRQHVSQCVKIPERLRHLLALDHQVRAMEPAAHKLFPRASFRLRDLCFVMRENIVHPAAMNIELIAEQLRRHRAALDMPARPAVAPRTTPFYRAVCFIPRFPEREIADVFLVVLVALHPAG